MRKIIKFLFYSKHTPILGFPTGIIIFLIFLYLVIMPIAVPYWSNTHIKNITGIIMFLFIVIWPLYCIVLSIHFLKAKKNKKQAIAGLILNISWFVLLIIIPFLGLTA